MSDRVLIVDDDEALRESLELVLVSEGYQVATAPCGASALERLEEQPVDVVLCDLRMPGIDGFELIPQILRQAPNIPIVLMSAYGTEDLALEAIRRRSPEAGEAILLHGRLPQSAVAKLYRSADLLVLPSEGEGAPLAVMEALASGLPVLATPVGGIPELVHDGETGWLADHLDTPGLALVYVGGPTSKKEKAVSNGTKRSRFFSH